MKELIDERSFSHTKAAFSRNLGWVTQAERDGPAGTDRDRRHGRVGGGHLLTLARLGVRVVPRSPTSTRSTWRTSTARLEPSSHSLSRPKAEVLADDGGGHQSRSANCACSGEGRLRGGNLEDFLAWCRPLCRRARLLRVRHPARPYSRPVTAWNPAVTAAPLGTGSGGARVPAGRDVVREYFQLEGCDERNGGAFPDRALARDVAVRLSRRSLAGEPWAERRGRPPLRPASCVPGLVAPSRSKILLGRGGVRSAPQGYQFDAYRNRLAKTLAAG